MMQLIYTNCLSGSRRAYRAAAVVDRGVGPLCAVPDPSDVKVRLGWLHRDTVLAEDSPAADHTLALLWVSLADVLSQLAPETRCHFPAVQLVVLQHAKVVGAHHSVAHVAPTW